MPHQQNILDDISSFLATGKKEGYVELATAGGKTYLESKITDTLVGAGLRVLVLSNTKHANDQFIGLNGNKGLSQFASKQTISKIGRQYGGYVASPSDQLVISTYQSLNGFSADNRLGDFDVIVCDEAHRALGDKTRANLIKSYPHAIKLGFTATPNFGINKSVDQVFPEVIHSLNLREAIDSDIVAPVQCLTYTTGEQIQIVDPTHQDFSIRELRRLINLKSRNEKAASFACDFVQDGRRGIVACLPGGDLAHAKLMAQDLQRQVITDKNTGQKRNIVARAVGRSTGNDAERKLVLKQFEDGEIDVLTFVDLISESWDSDQASFLINARPTTSIVKITQQIGRVIRKKKSGLHSIVVDFIDDNIGKQQKTALQALGEDRVELNTIYGNRGEPGSGTHSLSYLRGILSPELYSRLMSVDGRLINELTIAPKEDIANTRALLYERMLEKDGLYPDTHLFGIPNKVNQAIDHSILEFEELNGRLPTADELFTNIDAKQLLGGRDKDLRDRFDNILLVRDYDLRGTMIGSTETVYDGDDKYYRDPQELADDMSLKTDIGKIMLLLDERKQFILNERNGLVGDVPRTYAEIGEFLGISAPRVRDIESYALSELSRPNFADVRLSSYMFDPDNERRVKLSSEIAKVSLLNRIASEPIGLQSLLISMISPGDRSALFNQDRSHFPLVIQKFLKDSIDYEKNNTPDYMIHSKYLTDGHLNKLGDIYVQTKKLLNGDYNIYIKQAGSETNDLLANIFQFVPATMIGDTRVKSDDSNFLYPGPLSVTWKAAERYSDILTTLDYSNSITDLVFSYHKSQQNNNPEYQVPRRNSVAKYLGNLHNFQVFTLSSLAEAWSMPGIYSYAGRVIRQEPLETSQH